ncbi:MAG: ATP-binding protein [Gemmatimonadota bacterium]|nr:ATP-binding protein [Gemmatimonadota bacterium]
MTSPLKRTEEAAELSPLRVLIELEIPSDVRYIEQVVALVTRHCLELHFNARHCSLNVPVALTEALSNAILRGNEESPHKQVRIRAEVSAERLVVDVVDQGEGFELGLCLSDPTSPANLLREDGRGLFLMTRLMDQIERYTEGGNVVRMVLRRHD